MNAHDFLGDFRPLSGAASTSAYFLPHSQRVLTNRLGSSHSSRVRRTVMTNASGTLLIYIRPRAGYRVTFHRSLNSLISGPRYRRVFID